MKRGFLVGFMALTLGLTATPGRALADPGGPNLQGPLVYTCDNGSSYPINPGTATNRARAGWVIDATTVYVVAYFAVTDGVDTFVFFDQAKGLGNLVTCRAPIPGATFVAKGFFTSR